ncbi:DUF1357 family protein (plasmid) [Borrelia miyamotoi]|uniref:DUF1357 family protein n=1 Tax=Borrelia miyamotoi TaxID=47466 RepID=A0AAQ3CNI7_9SPIR|nr:DUF1357 family protein [Borrelia miyamotoi]WAZ71055.1 DUF1357 family protein [Borrelia miyamotoi]WCB91036.1 DUF1357 family protein [Borrelia miyamotoi]WCL22165.1 DUF1357 family protein [Borrelia miyamotoi]WDE70393.1 DUF1357 family protein [Borrelia miyamotoi]WDE71668.1 DUF1357 family protein [Borrelia miyamotoi]
MLEPNFTPQNFNEFNISIVNAYKAKRIQVYNLKTKKTI